MRILKKGLILAIAVMILLTAFSYYERTVEVVSKPVKKQADDNKIFYDSKILSVETEVQPKSGIEQPPADLPVEKDTEQPSYTTYYTGKVVVLTYHHISLKPVSGITIKPQRFEADLKMLKDGGFNVISMRKLIDVVQGREKAPDNAVVITFDDGYESFYKYAYPLLKKFNMPATSFVITSWTESYSPDNRELNSLSPDQIREMYKSGIVDIQSHSHNGHDYIIKDEKGGKGGLLSYRAYNPDTGQYESEESYTKRVAEDLSKSISIIKNYIGVEPDTLCFPFGHYNKKLIELGKQAGFKYFVTTQYGYNKENSKSILIKRIRAGDAKLSPEKLKANIIGCGSGSPVTP